MRSERGLTLGGSAVLNGATLDSHDCRGYTCSPFGEPRNARGLTMGFFSFVLLLAIAYLLWRIADTLPDLIHRVGEIQRDIGEIRRRLPDADADV